MAKDMVQPPALHSQANATRLPHLQTLWDVKVIKVACLPLVAGEVVDAAVADHRAMDLHLRCSCPTISAMLDRCTPTSSRNLPVEMYVFLVVLTWRMDIRPNHALQHGGVSTTRRVLIVTMPISILQQGTMRA